MEQRGQCTSGIHGGESSERCIVTAIVLNWNNAEDSLACLKSLAASQLDCIELRTILVDNGSRDDSLQSIRSAMPELELLALEENFGYAEGNNRGIRAALRGSPAPDYLLILNNDTLLDETMIRELVSAAEEYTTAAMLGPLVLCAPSREIVFAAGSEVDWRHGRLQHRGLYRPEADLALGEEIEEADFLVGCGLLVRSEAIEALGMMDPRYYLNFEDVEWGVRAWRRGWRVLVVPRARLYHKVSATLGLGSPANTYYMTRNALLFFRTCAPSWPLRVSASLHIWLRSIRTLLAWSLRPRYRDERHRAKRRALWEALRDFSLGRFGPRSSGIVGGSSR